VSTPVGQGKIVEDDRGLRCYLAPEPPIQIGRDRRFKVTRLESLRTHHHAREREDGIATFEELGKILRFLASLNRNILADKFTVHLILVKEFRIAN
jgi:hypothetical protein